MLDFSVPIEHQMLHDLVKKFVREDLLPLEKAICQREAAGATSYLTPEEQALIDARARELGLFGLDAPEEVGGADLPVSALVAVNEELGTTPVFYVLPPDTPNLTILLQDGTPRQRDKYLAKIMSGEFKMAIAISEPGAGGDPSGMKTRAVKSEGGWVITGNKIWISAASTADFIIAFAVTGKRDDNRSEVTAFFVDKDQPGMTIGPAVPMLGGWTTYPVNFDECYIADDMVLGEVGNGWAPMQKRLESRRVEVSAWAVGAARRAVETMLEYAPQRVTFGQPLADRQVVQFWIAEAQTSIHAARLMCLNAAWKIDNGIPAKTEVSMLKAFATEMAWKTVDRAMQLHGGMGVSKEMPLYLLAEQLRTARIYEGPTEVHLWRTARDMFKGNYS